MRWLWIGRSRSCSERAGFAVPTDRVHCGPFLVAGSLLATACGSGSDPESIVQPAALSHLHEPVVIHVPERVEAGVPFGVSLRTYAGGCVSHERIDIRIERDTVHIRPLHRDSGHEFCTDDLVVHDHAVTLRLTNPGRIEVVFHGASSPAGSPVAFSRTVEVE